MQRLFSFVLNLRWGVNPGKDFEQLLAESLKLNRFIQLKM